MHNLRIAIFMPTMGHATGEMPHLRNPPKNWMPGQNLYYLYTACRNLGYQAKVIDANWSREPIAETVAFAPDKILISTATPTFQGTLAAISALREHGYEGEIFVGGPHVSLNHGLREFLLPELPGVTYVPLISSWSTFDWVPVVFPGRSPFDVLGLGSEEVARAYLAERWTRDTGKSPKTKLESYIFTYFEPSFEWMFDTYQGDHIRDDMRAVPIRYSIITSIGCSKSCSFCGNPYIYRIGFKNKDVVRNMVRAYLARGIRRISVHDMYFVMYPRHAEDMMEVFREEGMEYSMQTCLENLDEDLLDRLEDSGLQKFLVGIENPASYTVGKKVELDRVLWLLDQIGPRRIQGVKLSYIVGLPGVAVENDLALLHHIVSEIRVRNHPLEDLQVNLYTPYRPEGNTRYMPYVDGAHRRGLPLLANDNVQRDTIHILTQVPFGYWGCFPVGIRQPEDFTTQLLLCDVVYSEVYNDFLTPYLELRAKYLDVIRAAYPSLAPHIPQFEDSVHMYKDMEKKMEKLAS